MKPKDYHKGFVMLRQESIPSNCQVCEEFLQGYHELLQRVSVSALYDSNVLRYLNRLRMRFVEEYKFLWRPRTVEVGESYAAFSPFPSVFFFFFFFCMIDVRRLRGEACDSRISFL